MSTQARDRAVVLGGSIAGLLAARVLAETYTQVLIVERDPLPRGHQHRRGVPHGHHIHGMLPLGCRLIEELLPGISGDLIAAGAAPGDILGNVRWHLNGRLLRQAHSGLGVLSAGRPLIEGAIRERVLALPNVAMLDGHDIVGLRVSADRARVTGARATSLYGQASQVLPADLVVDATGRGSRTPRWLADIGYQPPREDVVRVDLSYATRVFDCPPELFGDDVVAVVARFPGQVRSGVMQRLEGNRALVTLAGVLGERPPLDLEQFTAYARSLAAPDIYHLVRAAEPAGDPVSFRTPSYVRHRYEQLADLPAGLFVAGDAVCAFNPTYGQGMSVAAAQVAALRDELSLGEEPDPHRYFAAASSALDTPWGISVAADMALPGVTGPVMPPSPVTAEYMTRLQYVATLDAKVAAAYIRVTGLIDPASALLRPEVVARVEEFSVAPVW